MDFSEKLNEYITLLGCTGKELAAASGLSSSAISGYRGGSRIPTSDAQARLIDSMIRLAEEKEIDGITRPALEQAFAAVLAETEFPYERLRQNLDTLIAVLSVNVTDLARSLNYDPAHLFRIRSGQRRPSNPTGFAAEVARYIARRYSQDSDRAVLARLMGCDAGALDSDRTCMDKLTAWLANGEATSQKDMVYPFLSKVDEFDLNEFTRSVHYDELKVPTVPFQIPTAKSYYGFEEMRQGELDFFKAAVLSKSMEPLILHDDTPMSDRTAGTDFVKKFSFAVAVALKKGLHIRMIHNIDRPFEEMMMGLAGWIPMYMTGQISPYYLRGASNAVFGHFLYSSGTVALSGECIMGFHDNGRFTLTTHKTEVEYYRTRAKNLLSKASPLMDIYRAETEEQYRSFLQKDAATQGVRRAILSALPLYTISDELLRRILERSVRSKQEQETILAYAAGERERMEEILLRDAVTDEIPVVSENKFAEHPMMLSLSGLFHETDVPYTYEEYREHMVQTEAYAEAHLGYTLKPSAASVFRNIQINILEGHWAVVSKNKAPAIHFVIRHPKLRSAIENFIPPLAE